MEGSAWFLLPLLHRAGFIIDVVTSGALLRWSRFPREVVVVPKTRVAAKAVEVALRGCHDWVVVTEDGLLGEITRLPIPLQERMAVLPILHPDGLGHLYSKIGLAGALEREGVRVPAYGVASTMDEAVRVANRLGFPVALKVDASSGGGGTFACANADQLRRCPQVFDGPPVLVQQWIQGRKFDADPLYLGGRLARVTVAYTESSQSPLGVSKVRRYLPPGQVTDAVLDELDRVGRALHAHGFANVTAIEDAGGRRHYFEADLRPNVWSDHGRFIGCDMAEAIRAWFQGRPMPPARGAGPLLQPVLIPHVARLTLGELVRHPVKAWLPSRG